MEKQVACGLDIINDGEQGRTDYTTHVKDRLAGFDGPSSPPLGTGEPDFPELSAMLAYFASPFQHRPACSGPVGWKDFGALEDDIAQARQATAGAAAQDVFMTSPSPGQIARYLKNQYYPSDEAYLYALADVMAREYRAIVDAGFILQLDCPDLALSRHMVFAHLSLDEFRKVITTHVEALNHAVRDIPPERMRMHICWASTQGPHHKDVPLKDIVDIVLKGRPQAVSFPGANPRHGHEWKVWKDVKLPDGKIIIPGVIDSTSNFVEHPELVADRLVQYAARGRTRERHRRRRLRLRHLRRPAAGRFQDRMDEARVARRRSAAGVARVVVSEQQGGQRRHVRAMHALPRSAARRRDPTRYTADDLIRVGHNPLRDLHARRKSDAACPFAAPYAVRPGHDTMATRLTARAFPRQVRAQDSAQDMPQARPGEIEWSRSAIAFPS